MRDFYSLLPARSCVVCSKTLEQVGGRRITAQNLRGMAIWHKPWSVHDRANLQYAERLIDDDDFFLNVWGEDEIWTSEVIVRITKTYLDGLRPWFCQGYRCGNRQCPECGYANNLPIASDLLYDDGRNPHLMVIPSDCGCVNRSCSKFREFDTSWEIVQVTGDRRSLLSTKSN